MGATLIRKVVSRLFERDVDPRLWNPVHRWKRKPIVLVFVELEDGRIGIGEASTSVGPGAVVAAAVEHELAPLLVGRSIYDVRAMGAAIGKRLALSQSFGALGGAWSGAEIALWDLLGQDAGLPIYKLLGRSRDSIYCYASAGLYRDGDSLADLRAEVEGYVRDGYTGFKMKVGGLSQNDDLARIAAAREALGSSGRLMIDAAGALRPDQALGLERAAREQSLYWFEAPIAIGDFEGLAWFRQKSSAAVAAHEVLFGAQSFGRLIRADAVDFVQLNVTICGGLVEGLRIGALAEASSLATTIQFSGSFVGLAASLQLAACLDNLDSVEIHMIHRWLEEYRDGEEWSRDGSYYRPGERPGLGLAETTRRALAEGS